MRIQEPAVQEIFRSEDALTDAQGRLPQKSAAKQTRPDSKTGTGRNGADMLFIGAVFLLPLIVVSWK